MSAVDERAVTDVATDVESPVPAEPSLHKPLLPAIILSLAGVLFVVYPVLRPYAVESSPAGATAFASPAWVAAHLCAVVAFIGVGFGLLGLRDALAGFMGGRLASWALVTWWLGAGLVLTYYGAETYALNALGGWIERTKQFDLLGLADSIRLNPVPSVVFAVGLGLLVVASVLTAVGVLRSGAMPPGAGLLFAIGFCTYLPQFFAPAWVRIAHGVITGVGCIVLAIQLRRLGTTD